jgi:hypothetical protein
LCLTSEERFNLALKFFEGKAGEVSAFLEEHDFFPLLCGQIIDFSLVKIKWFFKKRFNITTIVFLE